MKYILLFLPFFINAQIVKVQGSINSNYGPLEFATISIVDSGYGVTSNENGYFEIQVDSSKDNYLLVSYLGYISKKISLKNIDKLSNGRVEAGVGRGIYGREALNMNADADMKDQAKNFRLFEETLTIIKKAWTEKFFKHEGEFYTYPAPNFEWEHDMSPPSSEFMNLDTKILEKINIVPQPVQKPHPPLWQVVDSPSSIEWAAKNDISIIMWIPPVQSLKKRFEIYQQAKSEKEKRHVELGEGISVVRDMFVADSMDEAKEKAGEQMVNYMRWVCHWRGLGTHMNPGEELPKTNHKLDLLSYEFLHERNMLFGTVDYIINKIEEMQTELNLQNLKVWSNFPGVKHEDCMKSIQLFTEKIIPHFKSKEKSKIKAAS